MRGLALVILLTACRGGGDDDYRIIPGGDDTTISPRPDAPPVEIDAPDGGATIAGRVCLLSDARKQTECATTGVMGVEVTLGGESATTGDDGTFTITAPQGTNLVWHVTGLDVEPSVMPLTSTALIPTISTATYDELLLQRAGHVLAVDQGSVFVRVVSAGAPLANAIVTSNPAPLYGPFYDNAASGTTWLETSTGPLGVAWLPGITGGIPTTVTVTPSVGTPVPVDVPVEAGAITFATVDVP